MVAEAQVRWVKFAEEQSKSNAREVRKWLKSRGVCLFGNVGPVTVADRERAGRAASVLLSAWNQRRSFGSTHGGWVGSAAKTLASH